MYYVLGMQIPNPKAYIDEDLPYDIIHQRFSKCLLFAYYWMQISKGAVFKDDIYFLIIDEGVKVAHDIRWVQALHSLYLLQCLKANFLRDLCHIYDLDDIIGVIKQCSGLTLTYHATSCRWEVILDLLCLFGIEQNPLRTRVADTRRLQAFDLVYITKGSCAQGVDYIKHRPAEFHHLLFGVRVGCLLLHFISLRMVCNTVDLKL